MTSSANFFSQLEGVRRRRATIGFIVTIALSFISKAMDDLIHHQISEFVIKATNFINSQVKTSTCETGADAVSPHPNITS